MPDPQTQPQDEPWSLTCALTGIALGLAGLAFLGGPALRGVVWVIVWIGGEA